MKKLLFLLSTAITFLGSLATQAQSFSIEKDTVRIVYMVGSGVVVLRDSIIIPAGSPSATLQWKVNNSTFPTNWYSGTGICDNNSCYQFNGTNGLWPAGTLEISNPYSTTNVHDFHLQVSLATGVSSGTYYTVVQLHNAATLQDTNMVFMVSVWPTAVPAISKPLDEISLYPNPATNEVNVVFDANADVKSIAVYNNIGRAVSVYKVNGNSANINLENVPSGIYFVRLVNSLGEVVITRKFTKQ